jgi:RsiW-degrading membrane proteinase PrsW (M82 family)
VGGRDQEAKGSPVMTLAAQFTAFSWSLTVLSVALLFGPYRKGDPEFCHGLLWTFLCGCIVVLVIQFLTSIPI